MKLTTLIVATVCAGPTCAAVVNGDFQTGSLSGFSTDQSGGGAYSDFVNIQSDGGNSYAQLTTGSAALGLSLAALFQDIEITSASSYLTFDASLVSNVVDPFSGVSAFQDNVTFYMFDALGQYVPIFGYLGSGGGGIDPFGGSPTAAAIATLSTPGDSFFDTGVAVDLSDYVGQTVQLGLLASAYNDGRIVTAAFDNITLSQQPAMVPLPASLPLFLMTFGAFSLLRRRP